MLTDKNKKLKIKYCFEVHSFKYLYNNCTYRDLIDYAIYLKNIYFNVHLRDFYISSKDKSTLIRFIRDLEFELIKLTYRGF